MTGQRHPRQRVGGRDPRGVTGDPGPRQGRRVGKAGHTALRRGRGHGDGAPRAGGRWTVRLPSSPTTPVAPAVPGRARRQGSVVETSTSGAPPTAFASLRGAVDDALAAASLRLHRAYYAMLGALLDDIATVLSVFKDGAEVENELRRLSLPGGDALVKVLAEVSFDKFHALSLKALRRIVPLMEKGLRYDEAVAAEVGDEIPDPTPGTTMLYTSGTTGRPKGVYRRRAVTRRSALVTAMEQNPETDRHLCTGPLYHGGGNLDTQPLAAARSRRVTER